MIIFFDTEFTGLGIDPKLISIGFITEDGAHEFYAELSDTYQPADCSSFVREAILPHLQGGDALMTFNECATRLLRWLIDFDEPVQLATDSLAWDWMWIEELFAEAGTGTNWPQHMDAHGKSEVFRPPNVDGKPFILSQTPQIMQAVEFAFRDHVPRLRRHHALDDAKVNRLAWLACNEAELRKPKRIERFIG